MSIVFCCYLSESSDELFVGEVPDLAVTPFKSLQHLTFEGDEITPQVAKFLLRHSSQLETFHLALSLYDQAAKGEQDCWLNPGFFSPIFAQHQQMDLPDSSV